MELTKHLIEKNKATLKDFRIIIVQHLMSDTFDLVMSLINNNIEIMCLFAKKYSINRQMFLQLSGLITIKELNEESDGDCKSVLEEAIIKSNLDGKNIAILDLGGEYAKILQNINHNKTKIVIVEDTAYGHRRYEKLSLNNDKIFIRSVATSMFKEIEAKFVGSSIVHSTEDIFRSVGRTLVGENVLVIGYGMIGKNVTHSLKCLNCNVSVYDVDFTRLCHAHFDGYNTGKRESLIASNHIIFGVTGTTSIDICDVDSFSNPTVLISGSSKQIEFSNIFYNTALRNNDYIQMCKIKGKTVFILNNGFPVNFTKNSVPNCIIDFVFAEMIMCLVEFCNAPDNYSLHLTGASHNGLEEISQLYFINRNDGGIFI